MAKEGKQITLTEAELEARISKAVKKAVAGIQGQDAGGHALTADQLDMLSIIAPEKAKRHEYETVKE